uniref:Uncharacterized protein n=1 Tax=Candidatus Kentrum eta TaxID=2126337 RepID=A0A450VX48_9GAMM|nr:MAG: hypothetical protein BECKH772B_GA0070898_105711 [Candidatus Kentron sp. H]VFK05922.1 MAG: hypothetical protein BECKH772A_GA0070896_106001 [Candidatus Kentron sp. H]VFK09325.1 MAG: hypothetical protein BECKH772C_GA0070978_105971 [Candidatus Kentron sp. H]
MGEPPTPQEVWFEGPFGDIRNWQAIAFIRDANILGIEGAPEGFRAWALENGAVEREPAGVGGVPGEVDRSKSTIAGQ